MGSNDDAPSAAEKEKTPRRSARTPKGKNSAKKGGHAEVDSPAVDAKKGSGARKKSE